MPETSNAIQIKVTLAGTSPAIWRRIVVPSAINFFDLHHILQISMGWKNSHLFEFQVGDYRIGFIDEEFEDSDELADALEVQVDLLLGNEKATCVYVYDFGDHWEHVLEVEKVEPLLDLVLPACIEGELNCPPEDCGGIPGFMNLLEILKNKSTRNIVRPKPG
ncbi:MAG: plasmid pRiA4b ORF-3 family protein [Bacteroidota bacterium]